MIAVIIRYDDGSGNDPAEAETRLPIVPRVGDNIEVWVDAGGYGSRPEHLEVKDVILCTYAPERIEVWISTDGHPENDMHDIFKALRRGDKP